MASIYDTVKSVMDKYGVPEWIWAPIMQAESSGNPSSTAITSKENSFGLFQINTLANPEYAKYDLYDPEINAEIAASKFLVPSIKAAESSGLTKPQDIAFYTYFGLNPTDMRTSEGKLKYVSAPAIKPQYTEAKATAFLSNVNSYLSGDSFAVNGGFLSSSTSASFGAVSGGVGKSVGLNFGQAVVKNLLLFAAIVILLILILIIFGGHKYIARIGLGIATEGGSEATGIGKQITKGE